MKFNSQICTTKEQSERLLALGLKKETADMVILEHPRKEGRYFYITKEDANWEGFPAWSLHRLMEMIPSEILMEDYYLILGISFDSVYYADNEYAEVFQSFDGTTYSCIIKCIEWLIKKGYFNKEYLEE